MSKFGFDRAANLIHQGWSILAHGILDESFFEQGLKKGAFQGQQN
jgi:hypothetical protein